MQVKSRPTDAVKRIVTTARAEEIEVEWADYHESRALLDLLVDIGVDEVELRGVDVRAPSTKDDLTQMLETSSAAYLARARQANDHQQMKMLLFLLARYRFDHGQEHFTLLQESTRWELLSWQADHSVRQLEVVGGECGVCRRSNGRIYSIDQALREMPIPHVDCAHEVEDDELAGAAARRRPGWCRCIFVPYVSDADIDTMIEAWGTTAAKNE